MAGGAPGARWAQFAAAWKRGMGMWVGGGKSERINACPAVGMSHAHVAASTE